MNTIQLCFVDTSATISDGLNLVKHVMCVSFFLSRVSNQLDMVQPKCNVALAHASQFACD